MRALSRCSSCGSTPSASRCNSPSVTSSVSCARRRRRAGIAQHAGPIAERVIRGIDGVAQAALFADLGEQPRAHAAAEHADRAPGLKIIGIAIGHAVVGDADVRLIAIVMEMLDAWRRRSRLTDSFRALGSQSPNSPPTRSTSRSQSTCPATPDMVPFGRYASW